MNLIIRPAFDGTHRLADDPREHAVSGHVPVDGSLALVRHRVMQTKEKIDACVHELAAGKVHLWLRLSEQTSLTDVDRSLAAACQVEVTVLECSRDLQLAIDAIDDEVRLRRGRELALCEAQREP